MLLGKVGLWELGAPFSQYSATGLFGTIKTAGFISTLVSEGDDIKTDVYTPVGGSSLYGEDLSNNVLIVGIESGGKIFNVPASYITNLYDGQTVYKYHYIAAKVGLLPEDYDMTEVANGLADTISQITGVDVNSNDIYTSVHDRGSVVMGDEEAAYAELKRLNDISNNTSTYTQLQNALLTIESLKKQNESLATAYDSAVNNKN